MSTIWIRMRIVFSANGAEVMENLHAKKEKKEGRV